MSTDTDKRPDWWLGFFESFRPIFAISPRKQNNAQARYVIKKLGLRPGSRFLDCPCGIGRIALPLARQGIRVTGVDICRSYLDELARTAARRGLKIDLVHADMRRISFDGEFHAAANLWTSFGYFEKEADNLLVLKRIYRALKPGGRFLLHTINRDWIMANYEPTDWFEVGGVKVLTQRKFDYATAISHEVWFFVKDGREVSHETRIRHYSYHELVNMFKQVGFTDVEGFGSLKDDPVNRDSRMIHIFGSRPSGR